VINHIARACQEDGSYTISAGTMNPALVFARLLEALSILDLAKHAQLTALGGAYGSIPWYAIASESSAWWDTKEATGVISEVIGAINAAAPDGYACQLGAGDRWELALVDSPAVHEAETAESFSEPPPHVSALRMRVRSVRPRS
jgi:hypothetical protein